MTSANRSEQERHLREEELELFLSLPAGDEAAGTATPEQRRHLDACERCQEELEALRTVHRALTALPELRPSPGFSRAVMQRVRLPVPWYLRAWQFLQQHWLAVVLTTAVAGASLGGLAYWVASQPEMTLGGLIGFTLQQLGALFWGALMLAARRLWATGLPDLVGELAGRFTLWQAVGLMGVLSLATTGVAAAMARLLSRPPVPIHAGRS